MDQARDQAEASGWIWEETISWPSNETRDGIVDRRQALYYTMGRLESAVARPSGLADWRIEIETRLAGLERALASHIEQVEAEDGMFAQVMGQAPHLAADVDSLRDEHEELQSACHTALNMAADWAPTTLRRRINILLGRLAIHRQYGAELLFDAYYTDIAAAD